MGGADVGETTVRQPEPFRQGFGAELRGANDGLSRAQVTRLITAYCMTGRVKEVVYQRTKFATQIRGFHSDNGSEFINYNVARLLEKLLIEQTKSRAHHSGDNGLVETKNGAIIRKHIGHGHIGAQHAEAMNQFLRQHLNPYINFHRPCAVPKVLTAANGKRRRVYLRWATPFELFQQVPQCENHLRPQVTLAELDRFAQLESDTRHSCWL